MFNARGEDEDQKYGYNRSAMFAQVDDDRVVHQSKFADFIEGVGDLFVGLVSMILSVVTGLLGFLYAATVLICCGILAFWPLWVFGIFVLLLYKACHA